MRKEKSRGITLIALVVTIVVLLILAGITISTLFGENGIISTARRAADATKQDEVNTQQGLDYLSSALSEQLGEYAWKLSEDGTKVVNKNHPEGIELGSYVNYDCTPVAGAKTNYVSTADKNGYADQTFTVADYKYGWRVVGIDNRGQLMLISEEVVTSTIEEGKSNTWVGNVIDYTVPDRTVYFTNGKIGYKNGIQELNNICDIYGHGRYATGGRLITIEEINKMTGLNGNNKDGNGTKHEEGTINEYGNKVTYYWDGTDKPYYESSNGLKGNLTDLHTSGFTYYDESVKEWKTSPKSATAATEKKEKIITITSNDYYYYVTNMKANRIKLYNTLFTNSSTGAYKNPESNEEGITYYIDSKEVYTYSGAAYWGLGAVQENEVTASNYDIVNSIGIEKESYSGVRPVVTLKSNIKLKANGTRDNCTLYDLSEK